MVPLSFTPSFEFNGQEMRLVRRRALWWERERALLVADLHLEKASAYAAHGQMLPPYDSRETLSELALAVRETGARRVFCLGDSFHDAKAAQRLEPHAAGMLDALTRALDWVWIAGNHDAQEETGMEEIDISGIILRHRAMPGEQRPEMSGHFHPRLSVTARGRRIARPCAVRTRQRMILPAFGSLTGSMDAASPEIVSALQPASAIDAVAMAGSRLVEYPLWRAGT